MTVNIWSVLYWPDYKEKMYAEDLQLSDFSV